MFIRTIYYVDVGNLPKQKAEEWIKELMEKHKDDHNDFDRASYIANRNEGSRIQRFYVPENDEDLKILVEKGFI